MPDSNYTAERNERTAKFVQLARVYTSPVIGADVFIADSPVPISYYKTDLGVHTAQEYQAGHFEVSQFGGSTDTSSASPSVNIVVTPQIQEAVNASGGLGGVRVSFRDVPRDHLDDPEAYREYTYRLGTVTFSPAGNVMQYELRTLFNTLKITIPANLYQSLCCNNYKGYGCWLDGQPRPAFVSGSPDTCNRSLEDCKRHGNERAWNGFASVPDFRFTVL